MPGRSTFCFFILFQMEEMDFVRPFISKVRPASSSFRLTGAMNACMYSSRLRLVWFSLWAIDVYISRLVYFSERSSSSPFIL